MSVPGATAAINGDVLSTLGLATWLLSWIGVIPTLVGVFAGLAAGLYYTAMFWDSDLMKSVRRRSRRWFKRTPKSTPPQ